MEDIERYVRSLGDDLGESLAPRPSGGPYMRYGTIATVNSDGTLDVTVDGTTLRGCVATTGCVGAQVGMRCVMLRQGPLATVMGLIAGADLSDISVRDAILSGMLDISGAITPCMFTDSTLSGKAGVDTVSSNTPLGSLVMRDSDGSWVMYNQAVKQSDDKIYVSHAVRRRKADNTEVTNGLYLGIGADGTRDVSASDVNAWKSMIGSGTVNTLWSGAWYMSDNQTATLSQNVSAQMSGIVLAWSAYSSGTAQNYSWQYTFVPKSHVVNQNGAGVGCPMIDPDRIGMKYVYVSNTQVKGNSRNTDEQNISGTNNVKFSNKYWVLRYVYGV